MGGTFLKVFVILTRMKLVDVHSHIDLIKDFEEMLERARSKGVVKIIVSGIDKETNRKAIELSSKHDLVEASVGIYPPDALTREYSGAGKKYASFDIEEEIKWIKANKDKIVGIGEVGMDFSDEKADRKSQEKLFVKMIALAKELELPLIVHSRKSERGVLDILGREKHGKVVMHCFCGKKGLVKEGSEKGYYFTIPPNIVRASTFQTVARIVNINQLLTETDAPYLSPEKGKDNEPANVAVTVEKIAEIKGFDKEETANNIFLNYMKVFQ